MSPYNLLAERWIPVRRASGSLDWIAPWQMAEIDDPPLRIESPRPDFDGALTQFLIGLVQTVAAPETKLAWRSEFDRPPHDLQQKFNSVAAAFNLDGEGPRFMQDLTLKGADIDEPKPIRSLLIDAPAEFFVKPGLVRALSYPMAAVALFTLQTNAPSGGVGHRTSLRGGGPMTTVILGDSLWRTVWLNVMTDGDFLSGPGNADRDQPADKFPWMAPTRTSEKQGGSSTTPEDAHAAQHFWGMPRRIRLNLDDSVAGRCDLSGVEAAVVSNYITKNYGTNYEGAWIHPLTPYTLQKNDNPPNPKKGQLDGIPYRDWPQLVLAGKERLRARVVALYESDRRFEQQSSPRLWVFGYDVDNMKPRSWYSGTTPILPLVGEQQQRVYAGRIQQCIDASEDIRRTLIQQIKAALLRRPQDRKGDLSFISRQFWADTEPAFFEIARGVHDAIVDESDDGQQREEWLMALHRAALATFTANSQEAGEFGDADVKRIAVAWNNLVRFTSPRSKKLRGIVDLPPLLQAKDQGGPDV
ncbi:MAG TPA: type I-E CRISPR-associated protein Cse1/CasA [Thermoanaerobaculia bacterium]|nr:type I-E CRISPR-associated protein Cse1/CasA [Thermoanaerobaculia bacterium]